MPAATILNEEHCQMCTDVLQQLSVLREECARCQRAGLDVSRAQAEIEAIHNIATGIKREWFPNRP